VIAVVATNAALVLFFYLRTQWDDAFWKQVVCALILAGAVSGMHWTAATGTSYTLILGEEGTPSGRWTVIVVAVIVCLFPKTTHCSHSLRVSFLWDLLSRPAAGLEPGEIVRRKSFLRVRHLIRTGESC